MAIAGRSLIPLYLLTMTRKTENPQGVPSPLQKKPENTVFSGFFYFLL